MKDNGYFMQYRDVNYWNELRATVSRKTYNKHANRLKQLNATKGTDVQKIITNLILEKAQTLQGGNVLQLNTKKYCKLTGIEIYNQREDSFLLSHQGLKYIMENHPDQYRNLERRFLSGKWRESTSQTKIKEIAHNIRSRYTSKQQRFRPNQLNFFEY
jgi:IS4 transposase